ncbi:hypothetical protein L1049_026320 [Liquidambar formosana]|uniref:RNase H type-1 domain-containing protein n=1 Tax=Liquidambar formosana TaxID=63359 RepID=A0AAP0NCI9_LIQFO
MGFAFKMGDSFNTEIELCGIRMGLKLAWDNGFTHIQVEFDCEFAIKLITSGDPLLHPWDSLILDCKDFLSCPWDVSLSHTLREGNSCADFIANWSHSYSGLVLLVEPLPGLGTFLFNDVASTLVPRP